MYSSCNNIRVKTKHGYFVANQTEDYNYPGIDVEFVPENESWRDLPRPRILFELTQNKELRVLIWDDRNSEDYTKEIIFDVFSEGDIK